MTEHHIGEGEHLYHVLAGDGDHIFLFAKDKEDVKDKVDKGGEFPSDMINFMVKLTTVEGIIRADERAKTLREVGKWVDIRLNTSLHARSFGTIITVLEDGVKSLKKGEMP